jgi:hypothetical protein
MEATDSDKHTSLLHNRPNYACKRFTVQAQKSKNVAMMLSASALSIIGLIVTLSINYAYAECCNYSNYDECHCARCY